MWTNMVFFSHMHHNVDICHLPTMFSPELLQIAYLDYKRFWKLKILSPDSATSSQLIYKLLWLSHSRKLEVNSWNLAILKSIIDYTLLLFTVLGLSSISFAEKRLPQGTLESFKATMQKTTVWLLLSLAYSLTSARKQRERHVPVTHSQDDISVLSQGLLQLAVVLRRQARELQLKAHWPPV